MKNTNEYNSIKLYLSAHFQFLTFYPSQRFEQGQTSCLHVILQGMKPLFIWNTGPLDGFIVQKMISLGKPFKYHNTIGTDLI